MIHIHNIADNTVELKPKGKINAEDVGQLTEMADALLQRHKEIKVLIIATDFQGWEDAAALEAHLSFVKAHHEKVAKLALIPGHLWQEGLATFMKMFLHPEIKLFDADHIPDAKTWLER